MPNEDVRPVTDDGLTSPEVGPWTETKHRLVSFYAGLFASSMKHKWDRRVYVELYAGAGYARIRNTNKLILGSPLLALKVKDPFDKYIFCEEESNKLEALKIRAKQVAPNANIAFIPGNCDKRTADIVAEIPHGSAEMTVL